MESLKRKCNLGILTRANGSALFITDETSVAAGVFAPVEVKSNRSLIDRSYIEAHFRPKVGLPGVKDRVNEAILKSIFESAMAVSLHPRTSIVVTTTELQSQNSLMLISTALNAACMAALDSGIDMRCMFAAVTCFIKSDGNLSLKPAECKAAFIFVFDSITQAVITTHTEGCFTIDHYRAALKLAREESNNLFKLFKGCIQIK